MNPPHIAAVRVAGFDEAAVVGDVLAAAFDDTPLGVRLLTERTARRRLLRRVFTNLAGWAAVHGVVHLRDDGAGAAIWLPGSRAEHGNTTLTGDVTAAVDDPIDAALIDLANPAELDDTAYEALETVAALLHPTLLADQPTRLPTFLLALGVDPDARREGVAHQLLDAHHTVLDERRAPSLAVAIDQAGQSRYTAAGYRPHHVDQAGNGLAVQWMVRRPP